VILKEIPLKPKELSVFLNKEIFGRNKNYEFADEVVILIKKEGEIQMSLKEFREKYVKYKNINEVEHYSVALYSDKNNTHFINLDINQDVLNTKIIELTRDKLK